MARKLVIRLEGTSTDLDGQADIEGVSLRFFATFAERLQDAYQRSAQAVFTGTAQEPGRLPMQATEVDVRLVDAQAGSLHLDLVPVDTASQAPTGDSLEADALDRLMSDLSLIARDPESAAVPKALHALVASIPGGVRQQYSLTVGDRVERQVELTSTGVGQTVEAGLASVDQIHATVRGVICAPLPAVILDTEEGRVQAATSAPWMEAAWALRDRDDLIATIVTSSSGVRLLAIRPAEEQGGRTGVPSVEETLDRFDEVLRILAR
jgi:hypothetical protein